MFIQLGHNNGVEVHDSTSTQVWGNEDSDCADDKEKPENAGKCPSSCQRDIDCLIASCSDCAVVDVVCDEEIDTAAYPQLAGKVNDEVDSYDDLDLADVPAEKKLQAPFGDSALFELMSTRRRPGRAPPRWRVLDSPSTQVPGVPRAAGTPTTATCRTSRSAKTVRPCSRPRRTS